jgi:hypothetical protein
MNKKDLKRLACSTICIFISLGILWAMALSDPLEMTYAKLFTLFGIAIVFAFVSLVFIWRLPQNWRQDG